MTSARRLTFHRAMAAAGRHYSIALKKKKINNLLDSLVRSFSVYYFNIF